MGVTRGRAVTSLNAAARAAFRVGKMLSKRREIAGLRRTNRALFGQVDPVQENRHKELWRGLVPYVSPLWYRVYSNASGKADYRYVPEDVFYAVIERRLNDINKAKQVEDKCSYDVVLSQHKGWFVEHLVKNVSGTYLDADNRLSSSDEVLRLLAGWKGDFVIKPSLESGGGENVSLIRFVDGDYLDHSGVPIELPSLLERYNRDFVIQPRVCQHEFFAQFNPTSVNTLRLVLYRSWTNEQAVFLNGVLRMGRGGMMVDNQRSGGISVGVDADGSLAGIAVDQQVNRYDRHPESGVPFKGQRVPGMDEILAVLQKIALAIPSQRLFSFDVIVDTMDNIKVVEINVADVEINFLQLTGRSLFGEYTSEIVDYCKRHGDRFDHIRVKV